MFDALLNLLSATDNHPGIDDFPWGRPAVEAVADQMATDGAHDASHLGRVFTNACRIVEGERERGETVDREVVAAAVLYHDAINVPKDDERRAEASTLSAEFAVEFFRPRDVFDEERLTLLAEAIERHSYSQEREPESLEAKIVCDADRLDALGAAGIARVFYVSGTIDGKISHPTDPFAERRELNDTRFAIDHFFEKLLKLRDDFLTPTGRAIAEQRHDYVVDFLEQFAAER